MIQLTKSVNLIDFTQMVLLRHTIPSIQLTKASKLIIINLIHLLMETRRRKFLHGFGPKKLWKAKVRMKKKMMLPIGCSRPKKMDQQNVQVKLDMAIPSPKPGLTRSHLRENTNAATVSSETQFPVLENNASARQPENETV